MLLVTRSDCTGLSKLAALAVTIISDNMECLPDSSAAEDLSTIQVGKYKNDYSCPEGRGMLSVHQEHFLSSGPVPQLYQPKHANCASPNSISKY